MWLAPFTPGQQHEITIELPRSRAFSRVRLWNYNASRTHAQRGARHAELYVDEALVWGGELQCALGVNQDARQATAMYFTDDAATLAKFRASDSSANADDAVDVAVRAVLPDSSKPH